MLDQAIEHYRGALKIRRELVELDESFKPKLADALSNLANAYYGKGLLDQAIEHYKEALKIRRELVESDACFKPKLANTLSNIGVVYRSKGLFDQAIEHYKEALKIRRELVESDACFKPKLADALNNLANAYYGKGLLDQAIEHYKEALKIRRESAETVESISLRFMTTLILLGIALGTRGTEEDKVLSKKLQNEVKSMLEDSVVIRSPQYPEVVSLAKILDSLVGEN